MWCKHCENELQLKMLLYMITFIFFISGLKSLITLEFFTIVCINIILSSYACM